MRSQIDGIVASSVADKIIITKDGKYKDEEDLKPENIYNLYKFMRSNSSTCMNQKPLVKAGDVVIFSQYGGNEVKIDGEEYLILSESDLFGVIN